MAAGVPPHPLGARDVRADRDDRPRVCIVHAWCVEPAGHGSVCRMFVTCVRGPLATNDFGPEASKRRRY